MQTPIPLPRMSGHICQGAAQKKPFVHDLGLHRLQRDRVFLHRISAEDSVCDVRSCGAGQYLMSVPLELLHELTHTPFLIPGDVPELLEEFGDCHQLLSPDRCARNSMQFFADARK
jgi:hypothetical protein